MKRYHIDFEAVRRNRLPATVTTISRPAIRRNINRQSSSRMLVILRGDVKSGDLPRQ